MENASGGVARLSSEKCSSVKIEIEKVWDKYHRVSSPPPSLHTRTYTHPSPLGTGPRMVPGHSENQAAVLPKMFNFVSSMVKAAKFNHTKSNNNLV